MDRRLSDAADSSEAEPAFADRAMAPAPARAGRELGPAYYRIYQMLRLRIASGTYAVGAQLPTDDALMREFSVSRHTARSAVQQLVIDGLVRRFPGKGTFVLARDLEAGRWGAQSLDDMLDRDFGERLQIRDAQVIAARDVPTEAAQLHLGADAELVRFRWLRSGAQGPHAFCSVFLPRTHADRLPHNVFELLGSTRLLRLVEQHCGVQAHRVRQVCSAILAEAETARRLQVEEGTALLSLRRTYFDRNGHPIEHSHILCRPDLCQQTVELFRTEG